MSSIPTALAVCAALTLILPPATPAGAQDDLPRFNEYDPPSTLVVPENPRPRAKFPFIDVHSHQYRMPDQDLGELVQAMDELNMAVMVNLSGRGFRRYEAEDGSMHYSLNDGDYLRRAVAHARETAPGRFVVFTNVDFDGIGEPDWTARAVAQLEADVANGAQGLKIYKGLGMDTEDSDGWRVAVDDPRLDPIWEKCGELGIPVLIHSSVTRRPMRRGSRSWPSSTRSSAAIRAPSSSVPTSAGWATTWHALADCSTSYPT